MISKGIFITILLAASLAGTAQAACLQSFEYQDQAGACQPCYYRCLTCQDNTTSCISCIDEFYLESANQTCMPCIKGCAQCSNATDCRFCNDGFYMNQDGGCSVCAVGSQTCSISITSSCLSTFYMLSGICAKCLDNCVKCKGPTVCEICLDGYFLENPGKCTACGTNCTSCNSTQCLVCQLGFKPVGANCQKCSGSGNLIYLESVGNCIVCTNYCQSCDTNQCYYCQKGYYLSQNGQCLAGASILCLQSNGDLYTSCKVDLLGCARFATQQYDTSSGIKVPVDVCLPKSYIAGSQFNYDSSQKTFCQSGQPSYTWRSQPSYATAVYVQLRLYVPVPTQIWISIGSVNSTIAVPMEVMSQPTQTSNCGSYVIWNLNASANITTSTVTLSQGVIAEIVVQSLLCSIDYCQNCTTAVDCKSCKAPYFLQFSRCVSSCDSGLYTYSTSRTCFLTCPNGTYAVQSLYTCLDCSANNCKQCSALNICLSCKTGFYLYGSSCVVNCTLASNATQFGSVDQCRACPFPCRTCAENSTILAGVCLSCNVGFLNGTQCILFCSNGTYSKFDDASLKCLPCDSTVFCATCTINDTTCTSCLSGRVLFGQNCISSCPEGYFSSNGICKQCRLPCLQCTISQFNCTACKIGGLTMYNQFGYCPAACQEGKYLDFTNTSNVTCQPCDSKCKSCFGKLDSNCATCNNNYYLDGTTCASSCPSNTTFMNSQNWTCSPCNIPCLTCQPQNGSSCTSCAIAFLDTPLCTLMCNTSSYPLMVSQTYRCTQCPMQCATCFSENSTILCTSCILPFLLFTANYSCIAQSACPAGYYNDTAMVKCSPCQSPCQTCNNSAVKCLTCIVGAYLIESLNYCTKVCPNGYYLDNQTCKRCSIPCSQCSIAPTNCTKCSIISGMQYYLYGSTCQPQCPSTHYPDNYNGTCQLCKSPCRQCYNDYYCKSCLNSSQSVFNKLCVDQCPAGTLSILISGVSNCELCINNCLECSITTSNCTKCPSNYYYYWNGTGNCLATCLSNHYGDIYSGKCMPCVSPCLSCLSYTGCLTCVANYSLFQTQCLTECPKRYYSAAQNCVACQSPCQNCLSSSNCTLCTEGFYMQTVGTCNATCSAGKYADNFTRSCQGCIQPCHNCSSSTSCLSCIAGTYLYSTNCLYSCPLGYFGLNSVCQQCSVGCKTCTNNTLCQSCFPQYRLYNNGCVTVCPQSTYTFHSLLETDYKCKNCSANCLNCSSQTNCTACQPSFFLENGYCKSICSAFYYNNGSVCLRCSQNCYSCINSTTCTNCFTSFIYNSSCYQNCPAGTFGSTSNMTCVTCVSPCKTCTSVRSCTSCQGNLYLYMSSCGSECPASTWAMVEDKVCVPTCQFSKISPMKQCYKKCPRSQVSSNGQCSTACLEGQYVSKDRQCRDCSGQCRDIFQASIQIVQTAPWKIVIYFNQRAEIASIGQIEVLKMTDDTLSQIVTLSAHFISDRSIVLESNEELQDFTTISVQLPYLMSKESDQSLKTNKFQKILYAYRKWKDLPNLKPLSQALSVIILIMTVVNIVFASGHYQQMLQLSQLFFCLIYLEMEYAPPLATFFQGFHIASLAIPVNLGASYIYDKSSSKFIRYNTDSNILRNCGLPFVLGILFGIILGLNALICRCKKDVKEEEAGRILTLMRKLNHRTFYRYLNDYMFIGMTWIGIFASITFTGYFITSRAFTIVVSIFVLATLVSISWYIFNTVYQNVQKRNSDLSAIQGLVEDLETDCSTLGLMHTPIVYLRRILIIFAIGFYNDKPVYALSLILVMSILMLVILIFYKPFKDDITDYICIMIEAIIVTTIFLLCLLETNKNTFGDNTKVGLCNFVVAIDCIALLVAILWWGWRTLRSYILPASCFEKNVVGNTEYAKVEENKAQSDAEAIDKAHSNNSSVVKSTKGHIRKNIPKKEKYEKSSFMPSSPGHKSRHEPEFEHWGQDQSEEGQNDRKLPEMLFRKTSST